MEGKRVHEAKRGLKDCSGGMMNTIVSGELDELLARARDRQVLLVFLSSVEAIKLRSLLKRFENLSLIVARSSVDGLGSLCSRIGYFDGAHWSPPPGQFETVIILGPQDAISVRGVLAAFRRGVRKVYYYDSTLGAWICTSIYVFGAVRLGRSAKARGISFLAHRCQSGWWSAFPQIVRRPFKSAFGQEERFDKTLQALFEYADKHRPALERNVKRVVLAIGTLGAGGAERQLVNTAVGLAGTGHFEPIVICSRLVDGKSRFFEAELQRNGIRVIDLSAMENSGLNIREKAFWLECSVRLARLPLNIDDDVKRKCFAILSIRPSIVHSFLDDTNVKTGIAAVIAGVPRIILSFRSVAPDNFVFHAPFMRPGYKALIGRPEVICSANSEAGAEDYRRWLGVLDLPISVIKNGIDLTRFAPRDAEGANDRQKFGLPHGRLLVGSVMRLTEEKGPILWSEVVIRVARALPDVDFVLVGSGELKPRVLELIVAAGLADRVHLYDDLDDIPSLFRCLDLFLLTSRLEGLPNVLAEAQAVGVPVVTTPAGGAVEALDSGRTGLIAENHSAERVAACCLKLLSDTGLRSRMSMAASHFAHSSFSISKMLNEVTALYKK